MPLWTNVIWDVLGVSDHDSDHPLRWVLFLDISNLNLGHVLGLSVVSFYLDGSAKYDMPLWTNVIWDVLGISDHEPK